MNLNRNVCEKSRFNLKITDSKLSLVEVTGNRSLLLYEREGENMSQKLKSKPKLEFDKTHKERKIFQLEHSFQTQQESYDDLDTLREKELYC